MDVVDINNLKWQTFNLDKTTFKNGNPIYFAKNAIDFENFNNCKTPCYHWYEYDINNAKLGCCYNYFALARINELVENNYRIPTLNEWQELVRITGYLFEDDDSHLWDSDWEYNSNRNKENIKALKDLKERGVWKKGNHSGNNRLGFNAKPQRFNTFSSWVYFDKENERFGTFCIGNSPTHKKIEAWSTEFLSSGFIRLVEEREHLSNSTFVKIGEQCWSNINFNHLNFKNIKIPLIEDSKQWAEKCRNENPAFCYYKNDKRSNAALYNFYACDSIGSRLKQGIKIASLEDFKKLFKFSNKFEPSGLLSLLEINYWHSFYLLDYRNFKSNGFNLRPEGYRKATFVTFWEGESLFNYKYFSGKGRVSMFWTSDGYIVKVFFELGKIKYETYNADKYYNGLGLSIRLIKH